MPPALIVLADDPGGGVAGVTGDADVADLLLAATLDLARQVGGVGRVLLFHPPEVEGRLAPRALGFRLWPADGDTPGERYGAAFRQAGELGYDGGLVVGLDVPTLPADRLSEAAAMLDEHQGVLIPGHDGGIAALGLQGAEPHLFPAGADVPDADTVRTRARQQLVRIAELEPHQPLTAETLDGYVSSLPG